MKRLLLSFITLTAILLSKAQTIEEKWIEANNQKIYGILSKPASTQKKQPLLIISHGFNGTHHFGQNYFELCNKLGYQCYSFDFPCGSINSKSDNNTLDMSIIDEQMALESIIKHFKSQQDIDTTRITLVGESQGGLVSSLVAANKLNNIYKLILVYPALCIPDNWNDRYKQISDIPKVTSLWGVKLGRRFFTEIRYLKPLEIIGKYDGHVQIVHGSKDMIVPISYAEQAVKIYPHARLNVIKGAGHGFKPDELKESLTVIEKFLTEQE